MGDEIMVTRMIPVFVRGGLACSSRWPRYDGVVLCVEILRTNILQKPCTLYSTPSKSQRKEATDSVRPVRKGAVDLRRMLVKQIITPFSLKKKVRLRFP